MTRHFRNTLLASALLVPLAGVTNAEALPVLFGSDAANIQPGETVTAEGSILQLQAPDGSIISFSEGSTFKITGEGDSLSFELVSGSMRVASQGMPISVTRGGVTVSSTGGAFSAFATQGRGLDGRVNDGTASVSNGGETREFARGDGYEADGTDIAGTFTPPVPTTTQVASNTSNGTDTDYSPADQQGSGGSSVAEDAAGGPGGGGSGGGNYGGTPPVTGVVNPVTGTEDTGYSIAYAADALGIDTRTDVTVTVGSGGELNRYKVGTGTDEDLERNSNSSLERGNAGNAIFIERWAGGETHGNYYNAYNGTTFSELGRTSHQGFHLAYGRPATSLPTQGVAQYTLAAATSPTIDDGSFAPGTFTGTLGIAFGPAFKVGVDFSVDMPGDHTYVIQTSGGSATPSGSVNYTDLANGVFVLSSVNMAQGGAACPSANCQAFVDGILGGASGEYVGIAYNIYDSSAATDSSFRGKRISGTAAFSQSSYDAGASGGGGGGGGSTPPEESGLLDAEPIMVFDSEINSFLYFAAPNNSRSKPSASRDFAFDSEGEFAGFGTISGGYRVYDRNDAVTADLAGTEYFQIGRWNGGDIEITGVEDETYSVSGDEGLVYLVRAGYDSQLIPVSGTAHYALKAATRPIYKTGIGYDGTFSGEMAILFDPAGSKVGLDALVTMEEPGGDVVYDLSTAGGASDPSNGGLDFYSSNGSFSTYSNLNSNGLACGGSCSYQITGYVSGPGGRDSGLAYVIGSGSEELAGAALFQRDDDASLSNQTAFMSGVLESPGKPALDNGVGDYSYSSNGLVTFDESTGAIVAVEDPGYSNAAFAQGDATIADAGSDGPISWARWTNGQLGGTYFGNPMPVMPEDGGMHLALGPLATNVPVSGTAQYGLVGATQPTTSDGSVAPGTFTGDLAVAFGANYLTARVGFDFNVSIGGHDYAFASTGGVADPSQSELSLHGASFGTAAGQLAESKFDTNPGGPACPNNSCKAVVGGFLSGNGATHAAVGYRISETGSPNNDGVVQGTAVFSQAAAIP
ncbi:hypothetical protein FHS78_001894 [Parvibaculum indicum]|uniref:FecR domain-containing protein n=1 Tax=Parvibaculum indicum TaxID=562969 RepID=UPI00141FF782|nr:FecR domain-containing protein [Parvibaculum indicum]NIJ41604.1 hypothetical protein [Parvibaculum indicum]